MACLTPKVIQTFFLYRIQSKEIHQKRGMEVWTKTEKKAFELFSLRRLRKTHNVNKKAH